MNRKPPVPLVLAFTIALIQGASRDSIVCGQSAEAPKEATEAIKAVLTDFHLAASKAQGDRYFGHLARDVVFLGTDATERFDLDALRTRAQPYFAKGVGWSHLPKVQHVFLSDDRKLAWFDETLESQKYGQMRGSGVLRAVNGEWKIVQYNLIFPVPNQLVPELVPKIAAASKKELPDALEFPAQSDRADRGPEQEVASVITDFHRAASLADGNRYFGHLLPNAILLGTDATERFTVAKLRSFVEPFFSQGLGWTSVPTEKNIFIAADGDVAWFDERVISSKYGEMRGTGVLKLVNGTWKIAHFNTGFPVPNELATELFKMIRGMDVKEAPDEPASLTPEQVRLNLESFDYVWTTVRDKYFDPTLGGLDWDGIRTELRPKVESAKSMSEVRAVLDDMISRLKVSHFAIIPAEAYRDLSLAEKPHSGVTGMDVRVVDGRLLVISVQEGSPSEKAGVKTGWEIARIEDDDVRSKLKSVSDDLQQHAHRRTIIVGAAQARLRGRVGDELSLVFLGADGREVPLQIPFVEPKGRKGRFGNIPEFYVWIDVKTVDENIGYIRFNAFMDPVYVMTRFNEAMQTFREADGIIIDVRGNGGGIGEMAMGMIGWFVGEGRPHLGTVIFRENELKMLVYPRPMPYRGPVVVLVDEMSVSAAEFFAGGIKDLGRAHIVGVRSAGAALGSSIEKLPNGDGFQYAAVNYRSQLTGKPLEGIGVSPNTEVLHTRQALLQGTDLQMEAAIKFIRDRDE